MREFLRSQKGKFISWEQTVRDYPATQCFYLSLPSVAGVTRIHEKMRDRKALFLPGLIVIINKNTVDLYHYDSRYDYPFEEIQSKVALKSPADMKDRLGKGWSRASIKDFIYDMPGLFQRENYETSKDWKDKFSRPYKLIEKHDMEVVQITKKDLPTVKTINDAWEKYKLETKTIFRQRFTNGWYYNFVVNWLNFGSQHYDAVPLLTYVEGEPFGFSFNGVIGDVAYGMSTISLYFMHPDLPSNINRARNLLEYETLVNRGLRWYNVADGNSHLSPYKGRIPHLKSQYYQYYSKASE